MRIIRALLLMLTLFAVPAQAVTFWEEGFETGSLLTGQPYAPNDQTQWLSSCLPNNFSSTGCNAFIVNNATLAHAGSFVFQSNYGSACGMPQNNPPGTTSGCGASYSRYFPDAPTEIWFRFWHKWTGYQSPTDGAKLMYLENNSGREFLLLTSRLSENDGRIWVQVVSQTSCPPGIEGAGTCNYQPQIATNVNDGVWHCIEGHAIAENPFGALNGTLQVYVDSVAVLDYTNAMTVGLHANRANPWNLFQHFTQYGNGTRWTDQIAVGSTRIGCGGAPPPPTLTPSAPTGVQLTLDWMYRIWAMLVTGTVA